MRALWWAGGLAVMALLMTEQNMSADVVALIKKHEGLRLKPYKDQAGHLTIGWGHRIQPGETFTTITTAQAEALLRADMVRIWNAIQGGIKRTLTAGQKAAVMCLAFNIGATAFLESTLLKKLNAGDLAGAAAEFPRWNKVTVNGEKIVSAGLVKRRADEQKVFLVA